MDEDENSFDDGVVIITWGNTVDDAKEVLEKLRAAKASMQADKREISAQLAEIRADYRSKVAHRIPVRGGGGLFGSILRGTRAAARAGTNDQVRPLERQKQAIDERLVSIDRALVHIRGWIAERGGAKSSRPAAAAKASTADPLVMLDKLATLRDRGAITPEEYEAKKAELLGRM